MSTHFQSDNETVDRYIEPTIEDLISQNKMKDLALSKATNLIQLLNIEVYIQKKQLEVERNSSQQNIQQIERQLKHRYESQIKRLQQKIDLLKREINRKESPHYSTEKTKHSFVRANSLHSLENKRKRSINKKYTDNQSQSNENRSQIQVISVKNQYFRQQMLIIDEWKTQLLQELQEIVKSEYNQLHELINNIQSYSDDFEELMISTKQKHKNPILQMKEIIKEQQNIINSLRAYIQQLEVDTKNILYKIQSLTKQSYQLPKNQCFTIENVINQLKKIFVLRDQKWNNEVCSLENQNLQLKNILDSMIKLVKQEKKIKY